jgi:hypothetical protein
MWPPYKKPSSFAVKDWVATAIAVLALIVSATTAYFNVIRTTDDLSVVATNIPELKVNSVGMLELSTSDVSVILINSGNRRAAISSFLVSVSQLRPDARHLGSECLDELPREDRTQIYKTGLDGLVVSDKEVRTQRFTLNSKTGPLAFAIAPFNKGAKAFSVVVCFDIDVVTPSAADVSNYQIVREWQVTKGSEGNYDVTVADEPNNRKPLQVYRRVGTIW